MRTWLVLGVVCLAGAAAEFVETQYAHDTEEIHNPMEMKGSMGGYMKFSTTKGMASQTGAVVMATNWLTLNMSRDVCQGGSAGSTWGFRDMGTQWNVLNVDMMKYGGMSIYYVVGDSMTESKEYMFKVPKPAGSSTRFEIIAYADQGVGYGDQSFNGRDNNNGVDAYGVAQGAAMDVMNGFGDMIIVGGDVSYADGYLAQWEDYFDMMEPVISTIPLVFGDGNHESGWFQASKAPRINTPASYSLDQMLVPPQMCIGTTTCPQASYVGNGWSQWESLSSGGECGLAYKMMPLLDTDQISGKTWWSVSYGPVTVVHYSTERRIDTTSPQYQWFVATLKAVDRTVTPWLIVVGHRAAYVDVDSSISGGDQDQIAYYQTLLDPILAETHVDLVFYGHTHVTERHCSSYQGKCIMNSTFDPSTGYNVYSNPQYPVYYSIANAGASQDSAGMGLPTGFGRKFTSWEIARSAYTRMTIQDDTLMVQYIDARTKQVLDTSLIRQAPPMCIQDSVAMPAAQNVILMSIDGLHQSDLDYMVANNPSSRIVELLKGGIQYVNANTTFPSDSFPGLISMITGGTAKTHGFWYDVAYSRALYPPGSNCTGPMGSSVVYDESVDVDNTRPDGGCPGYMYGNGCGINAAALPMKLMPDGSCIPWFPHQELRVNTIFEVARSAGFFTGWTDKHLVYELTNGPSGRGVEDLFTPELAATVDTDLASAATTVQTYDATHTDALLNWINGRMSTGQKSQPAGTKGFLVGGNYQSVSVNQKLTQPNWNFTQGGYINGGTMPSAELASAFKFVDMQVGKVIDALKATGQWNSTMVILTAKHGQSPVNKSLNRNIGDPGALITQLGDADYTNDDSLMIWYHNQAVAAASCVNLKRNNATLGADGPLAKIYCGPEVAAFTGADPATDPKSPDIIVIPNPGVIFTSSQVKKAEHGGNAMDDKHIGMIVGGGVIKRPVNVSVPAYTTMIAPTILRALGLDPMSLQGVVAESTPLLPGLFCREAGPGMAASTCAAGAAAAAPMKEMCGVRVLTDPSAMLRVDLRQDATLSSVTAWQTGGMPLLQTPAQLAGASIMIGTMGSMTSCAIGPMPTTPMMMSSTPMMGGTTMPSTTPMPAAAGGAGMPAAGGMMMMPGYAGMTVSCGAHGQYLTVAMPNIAAGGMQMLGAVHVKVCVVPGGDPSADAMFYVQNA